jgi:signal transduction histidine kinase
MHALAPPARRAAALLWGVCVALGAATLLLLAIGPGPGPVPSSDLFVGLGGVAFVALALTFATVGALVARRAPANRIGWIFLLTGLANAVQVLTYRYADVGLRASHHLAGASAATVVNTAFGETTAGLLGFALLLFPDGRLPSRRWRPALGCLVAGMVLLAVAGTLRPGPYDAPFAAVTNPFGVGSRAALDAVDYAGWMLVLAGVVAGPAALVVRLRRSRDAERRRLKLVLAVGAAAATGAALLMATWLVWPTGHLPLRIAGVGVCFALVPLAAGVAILRHGLFDIDVAIDRTVVYAAVTVILAAAFAATTLVLGTALGRGSAWPTAAATLLVALAFRPLRARVQDGLDRRFHRARHTALRRMADFLEDLRAGRTAPESVEGILREVCGDPRLALRFREPESGGYVDARGLPASSGGEGARIAIERDGRPIALVLHAPAGDDRIALLRQVVAAGGLAIEIVRLRVELRRRLAEVETSRARIVTAANEERRRIERDLHDGAQQRLVSIGLALRHAQHELGGAAPERASGTLDAAVEEIAAAIDELRELAHGLPPAQLDAGLAPALRELARRAPVPVELDAVQERFDRGVEAAAYFIACEALTNAVKHARATQIVLRAARRDGKLVVSVADDGEGGAVAAPGSGLAGLADRVAAHGGTLRIDSRDAGTTLTAELPCGS